jgi:acetyl esterase/lipase
MRKTRLWTLLFSLALVSMALAQQELTLEKVMQHPRWIGMWPEEVVFGPDGQSIFYLSHADPRGYQVVEITPLGEVIKVHDTGGLPRSGDRRGGKTIYAFKGDLFLSSPQQGRLTRTRTAESECRWLGDNRFVYRAGSEYRVHDLLTQTVRQIVDLRFQEEPKVGEDFRSQQQERLFPILKERADQETERSREQGIPRFYVGKDRTLVRLEVANDEKLALLVHANKDKKKRDQMPVYLNRDGQVTSKKLRQKVGDVDQKDHRLTLLDLSREKATDVDLSGLPGFSAKTTVFVGEAKWSPRGRLALSLFSEDFEERWIVEVDLVRASLKLVEHLHDDAWHSWDLNEFGWTQGDALWYQSEKTGFAHLYLWDGSVSRALTSGPFEVTMIHPAPDGRAFYYRSNKADSGRYDVYRTDLSGQTEKMTDLGGKTDFDLSPDGKTLVLLHSKTATPPEVYIQSTKPGSQAKPITRLASQDFLKQEWTMPRFVDVPSTHHDRAIRSKLYLPPAGVKSNGAAVVFVHGAGYTQNADEGWAYYFREFMFHTLLTRRGVTVLDMDYRASAGYGRDWRTAIYRRMGTPELEDLKDGVAFLVKDFGIEPQRVGVYGGSYGGFMTLMALFKEPDLFACGAALRPVTDWAQYEHDYTARILNTPEEDPESYLRSSPIEFAEGLTKPLLMCHGMLDDNVVAQDTVRLTQRLIQLKKRNWETALYPLEPHGFMEPESWLDEYSRIHKLFQENLEF